MEVVYYINDGYAGSRSKYVTVNDEDLEECETEEAKIELIEAAIQEHFEQNVSWTWDRKLK